MNEKINMSNHEVKILDRSFINLTSISKIISFNDEEFLLESSLGNIHIKGSSLEVIKMDVTDGNVKIRGHITGFNYLDSKQKNKEDSLVAKLFR